MESITSRQVTDLTGARGRILHDLCKDLRVGKTTQGSERHFSFLDACVLTLASRLNQHGLRRTEGIEIAMTAKDDLERLIRDPDDVRRWLFASRSDGDPWFIQVVDGVGSPEVLDDEGSDSYAVINLRKVVRDVVAAGARAA